MDSKRRFLLSALFAGWVAIPNPPVLSPLQSGRADRSRGSLQAGSLDRTEINPWSWSLNLWFDQAELVEGQRRELVCSGQTAIDADGNPQHPGDMAAQLNLALDNLEAVLAEAGMNLTNLVRLNIYTTNVDEFLQHFAILSERLGTARIASTLLGVTRLATPQLLIELEATAMD